MGLLDNFKRFVRGEDYDDFEDEYTTEETTAEAQSERERPAAKTSTASFEKPAVSYERSSSFDRASAGSTSDSRKNKVVNIHAVTHLSVMLVKPEAYENAREIADHLKARLTVVLNLEQTNRETAKRLLDFLSGVAYANDGQIKKIANCTYIITPDNVDLQGSIIDELENSGMFM